MSKASFVERNPLAVFLGLTFGFTWILIAIILVSTPPGIDPAGMSAWLFILALLAGFGPSLAGIITVRLSEGKEGLRALLGRLKVWRVGAVWYVAALLIAPLVSVLTLALMAALGKPASLGDVGSRIAIGLVWPIFSSLGEELGWRGFFLPKLMKRYNALVSGLIVGVTWGMWHLPMDLVGMRQYGLLFIPIFIVVGPILMTAQSVLMTWVYNHTRGSLLLMVLFHAGITGSAIILSAQSLSALDSLWHSVVSAVLYWLAAAVVIATTGAKRLAREPGRV